jgi:hypothetical protein
MFTRLGQAAALGRENKKQKDEGSHKQQREAAQRPSLISLVMGHGT